MRKKVKFITTIIEILLGIALIIAANISTLDEFWSGMGTGLLMVGALQLIRQIRYKTNETYRQDVDIAVSDERNKYIAMKAWSWAGYLFVLIAAVATIALKIAGYDQLVTITSGSLCLILVLYWVSYLFLKRKY